MKVAAIQMPTVKDKIQNIRTAGTYIEKIKAENPDFVILPEMFCFTGLCVMNLSPSICRQRLPVQTKCL